MGWGNESSFKRSWSHDQDGRFAHIHGKNLKNLLQNQKADGLETWYAASGARVLPNENQKLDPLRAMKTFIRRKVGHTT